MLVIKVLSRIVSLYRVFFVPVLWSLHEETGWEVHGFAHVLFLWHHHVFSSWMLSSKCFLKFWGNGTIFTLLPTISCSRNLRILGFLLPRTWKSWSFQKTWQVNLHLPTSSHHVFLMRCVDNRRHDWGCLKCSFASFAVNSVSLAPLSLLLIPKAICPWPFVPCAPWS